MRSPEDLNFYSFKTSWITSIIASEATIQVIPRTTADVAALPTAAASFPHFIPLSQPAMATITPKIALFTRPVEMSRRPIEPTVCAQYWVHVIPKKLRPTIAPPNIPTTSE